MLETQRGWETMTWSSWPLKKYLAPSECVQVSVCNRCFIGRSWQCVTRRELSLNKVYKQSRSCFLHLKIFTLRLKHTLTDTDSLPWKYGQHSVINMRISSRNCVLWKLFSMYKTAKTAVQEPTLTRLPTQMYFLKDDAWICKNRPGTLAGI